nr:MAG TPA: hypothetical protein [Bacteriophage sp.]
MSELRKRFIFVADFRDEYPEIRCYYFLDLLIN